MKTSGFSPLKTEVEIASTSRLCPGQWMSQSGQTVAPIPLRSRCLRTRSLHPFSFSPASPNRSICTESVSLWTKSKSSPLTGLFTLDGYKCFGTPVFANPHSQHSLRSLGKVSLWSRAAEKDASKTRPARPGNT